MPGSASKDVWINLTGSGVDALKKAFFGPSVTVLQENVGAKMVTTQAGDTVPKTMIVMAGTARAQKYIRVQQMYRVVLLGDTRAGKSSLANNIFGEDVFKVDNTECQAESKSVHGRRITLINTPDFSGPGRSEEALKPEILRCITEFPPGPHAFLIVLKVEKSTEQQQQQQQQAVIEKICQYFSEEAFKYAAVVFTQDDQVSEGMRIQDFLAKNKCVSDLVEKCKSRYHIVNNYKQQGDNISNQSQVAELLNKLDQILKENKGRFYTSKMLPQGDTCCKPTKGVAKNELIKLTGPAAASLAKAFIGPAVVVLTQGTTTGREEESKEEKATPKNTEEEEGEKQKAAKRETKAERKEGVEGLESFVGVLFGLVVGLGGPSIKHGAAFIAAALAAVLVEVMMVGRAVAAGLASAGGAAGAAGAAGAEYGRAKEAVRWGMQKTIDAVVWIRADFELMVIVFISLLLTWLFLKVPFFGTLLAVILFVSVYNLI